MHILYIILYIIYYNSNDDDDNDVSPPQLLQLNEDDRLHLGTSRFDRYGFDIQFCVNLLSVD